MISRADLEDDGRLHLLYLGAYGRRKISGSEADRLRFFAAAEQALQVAGEDAGHLFAWIVTKHAWDKLTDEAEDRGRIRVRRIFDDMEIRTDHRPRPEAERLDELWKETEVKLRAYVEATAAAELRHRLGQLDDMRRAREGRRG